MDAIKGKIYSLSLIVQCRLESVCVLYIMYREDVTHSFRTIWTIAKQS